MSVARFFNVLLASIALLVCVIFGNAIQKTLKSYFEVQSLADLAESRTAWSIGTVALSLERSVTQVALALKDPIPADLREIIDKQRRISDENLSEKLREVESDFQYLLGSPSFIENGQRLRTEIAQLRSEVDDMLSRPLSQRDLARVSNLPKELKGNIADLQVLADLLQIDSSVKSDASISIEALQTLAWEIREYGGRARTYFAIATLTESALSEGNAMAVELDSGRALDAWKSMQNILISTNSTPELQTIIERAGRAYFVDYIPVTHEIFELSSKSVGVANVDYGISFEDFFEQSSSALGGFEGLVVSTGDFSKAYWDKRREIAAWELGAKIGGLLAITFGLFVVRAVISNKVTSRVEAATYALTRVAAGDLDQSLEVGTAELTEILQLKESLVNLRNRLEDAQMGEANRATQQEDQRIVVEALSAGLSRLAGGDLSYRINKPFEGSYETLRENFNSSCQGLDSLIGEVVQNANFISLEASNLSTASQDLMTQTDRQSNASALTASSVERVAQSVQETAKKASETDEYVSVARASAEGGGKIVREAIGAMGEIKKSSDGISETIGQIDDIAFQTNLLALNAGIEAARAGNAGQGFAVVASEVRALAQRASEAAKEIKMLIEASTKNVERGVSLVGQTGEALGEIVDQVGSINVLASEISSASQEQSSSLTEVTSTVSDLEMSAKRTVDISSSSNTQCSSLNVEADKLMLLAGQFKITNRDLATQLVDAA